MSENNRNNYINDASSDMITDIPVIDNDIIANDVAADNNITADSTVTDNQYITDDGSASFVKLPQLPLGRSAVMDNVRLMENDDDLLYGLRLDPDGEDIGFGENALQPWNKPKPKKKNKKHIWRWIFLALAIVAISVTSTLLLLGHMNQRNNAPAPLDPENFPALYTKTTGEFNILPNNHDEDYTAVTYSADPGQDISSFIKTNNDGSVIFFADSAEAIYGGQYNLYYRRAAEKELDPSTDQTGYKIASNVMGEFEVSRNGKYVAYLKDVVNGKGKLYVSNLYYETAIEERDVVSFSFSDDNNYIMFHKNSGEQYDTVYIKKLSDDSSKIRIDNNVVKVVSCSEDFERIYYLTLSDSEIDGTAQDITGAITSPEDLIEASEESSDTGVSSSSQASNSYPVAQANTSTDIAIEQKSPINVALTNASGQSSYVDPFSTVPQDPQGNTSQIFDDPYNDPTTNPYLDPNYVDPYYTDPNYVDPYYTEEGVIAYSDIVVDESAGILLGDMYGSDMLQIEDVLCTFKLKMISRDEPIEIVDGVTSVSEVSGKGNFAFTMGSTAILDYEDLVDDEYASTDMVIHQPTREEYTVTTEVPNAPTQNINGTVSQTNKTVTTFDSESYNRAMEAYEQKAQRDSVRAVLKDQTVTITNNILYCFIDGSIVKISDDCDQYYTLNADTGLIAYAKRETESVNRYKLTELMEDPMMVINQTGKSDTVTLYSVADNQITELSRAFSYNTISQVNGSLYYLTDYDAAKQKGTLMQLDSTGMVVKVLDDVADYIIDENSGNIVYLTNLGDTLSGELHILLNKTGERTKIADSVKIDGFAIDEKGNVAALSGDDNTLVSYNDSNTYTIARNVSFFTFKGDGKIYFMQNYNSVTGGELSCFNGSDIDKISDNVSTLIWPYNEMILAQ